MKIYGLNKTTLLDYPGRVAATVFTGGCNFRCPFCHNGDLVLCSEKPETFSEEEVLLFLEKRRNILHGVCITGGEPTLNHDLREFIMKIRNLGLSVKLDTNGSNPEVLEELLKDSLLDYVAMDIKNSFAKYEETAGVFDNFERIKASVERLKNSSIPYEFRTTVVKDFHSEMDLYEICEWIQGAPLYVLQQFIKDNGILGNQDFQAYTDFELKGICERLNHNSAMAGKVLLRGAGS